jgi:hypothetical protein
MRLPETLKFKNKKGEIITLKKKHQGRVNPKRVA